MRNFRLLILVVALTSCASAPRTTGYFETARQPASGVADKDVNCVLTSVSHESTTFMGDPNRTITGFTGPGGQPSYAFDSKDALFNATILSSDGGLFRVLLKSKKKGGTAIYTTPSLGEQQISVALVGRSGSALVQCGIGWNPGE